jgi:hypothetical protein
VAVLRFLSNCGIDQTALEASLQQQLEPAGLQRPIVTDEVALFFDRRQRAKPKCFFPIATKHIA